MISALIELLDLVSLDVTRGLVVAGLTPFAALAITAATNATPIVITTATAHGVVGYAHGVIAGVVGNEAANNIDAAAKSITAGQNLAVVLTRIDDYRLSLSAVDQTTGRIEPLAGDGDYESGGTLTIPLVGGSVLIGREHVFEQSAPPRIVAIPVRSKWGPKGAASHTPGTIEKRIQVAQRSIRTENVVLEVHVWGQATPPDPRNDFDATRALSHQLIQSVHLLTAGNYELLDGAWADQVATATQQIKAGHEHVFGISIATPVLDAALPYAPTYVTAVTTTELQPADLTVDAEVSCTG
jgi:hypothetical protein